MTSHDCILRAEQLTKSYALAGTSETAVLRGISLHIVRGEILAIVGASGAGKSTLLHVLGALDEADAGTVTLQPNNGNAYTYSHLSSEALSALRNKHIGFIFQFHHLLPEFTALENVMMPALIAGVRERAARESAQHLLDIVGLAERLHHKPDALSGGEQQRVAFARALVNNPALVFADEPTGNLDATTSAVLLGLIQHFREQHRQTFVIVTHSAEIAQAADRVLTLRGGVLQE